jgi:hypothetical protein
MKQTIIIFFVGIIFTMSYGCQKEAGEGGSSVISGKLIAQKYNAFGDLIEEYDLADERVYIIYGENADVYDDNMRTSFNGTFRFDYLRKGTYRVFTYSKCPTCAGGEETLMHQVTITKNKEQIVIPTIFVRK